MKSSKSLAHIEQQASNTQFMHWLIGVFVAFIALLFLPWTQNIQSKGKVTTWLQEQRPQFVNSPIGGKIMYWRVKEGDFVEAGDTLLQLAEIKVEYLDPNLIPRTGEQVDAKRAYVGFYEGKIRTTQAQALNLSNSSRLKIDQLDFKLKQLANKLVGEKAELIAAENDYKLAQDQFERQQKLFEEGLVSQTALQQRNISFQNAFAKKTVSENKIQQTNQETEQVRLEKRGVEQDYLEKINKADGDRFMGLSAIESAKADIAKMENELSNYRLRNNMYWIIAPQAGQVVQVKNSGIGEIIKEGEDLFTIVPKRGSYAVELFVKPVDMPLIGVGQKTRFAFDGFPAIVFSGWPNQSYGTFGGRVVAVENTINNAGLFRVIITEDPKDRPWPPQVKIGTGAQGIALLKDVPVWYELWRNINGFPADFYEYGAVKEKAK